MRVANIMIVDRLRMGTDGQGITTLVAFYKCPLKCKYCINHKCHFTDSNSKVSAIELYNSINIDQLYFFCYRWGINFRWWRTFASSILYTGCFGNRC